MMVLRIIPLLLLICFTSAGSPYFVFKENGKTGLKNQDGKILIPAQYDALGWSNGSFSIMNNVTGFRNGQQWGLINLGNQRVAKNIFTELYPADGNLIIAGRLIANSPRPMTGCINTSGKQIIPFVYDGIAISSFRAIVFTRIGNQYKYGLIDLENRTLIPQQYQEVRSIGTLRYAVRNFEGKTALFSENGQRMTEFVIDSLSTFKDNRALIYQGKYVGMIDRDGIIRLEAKYRDIHTGDGSGIKVREADEWQFVTMDFKVARKVQADSVIALENGLFKIRTASQAQMVKADLTPVGNSILTDIRPFKKGRAVYQLGSLYGMILPDGRIILPAMYHDIILADNNVMASQRINHEKNLILFDSLGMRKNTRAYESMSYLGSGLFAVRHRGFAGLLNSTGNEVVACEYDSILSLKGNYVAVKFKGLYGVITTSGQWVVSPRPSKITIINTDRFIEHSSPNVSLKARDGTVIYFTSNPIAIHDDYFLEYLPTGNIWRIDMNGVIADRQVMSTEATESVYEESEGYRAIKRNGKFGFIDNHGRLRIANR